MNSRAHFPRISFDSKCVFGASAVCSSLPTANYSAAFDAKENFESFVISRRAFRAGVLSFL